MPPSAAALERRQAGGDPLPVGRLRRVVDRIFPQLTAAPAILMLAVLTVLPTFQLFATALFDEGQLAIGARVADLRRDPIVVPAIRNTLFFTVVVVALETIGGLLLAVAAARTRHGTGVYRTGLLLPLLVPGVVIGTMWRLMFDYNTGVIEQAFELFGVAGPAWISDPGLALGAVMVVEVWHSTSFLFLLFLAALATVPRDLVDAAEIDGASTRQIVRSIFIPLIRPVILIAVILRLIDAFKLFDVLAVLTNGGPGTATQMLNLHVFRTFFGEFRFGYGAFLGLILAAIIGVMVVLYFFLLRSREGETR